VYCCRSCLCVCNGGRALFVCGSVTTITRNCVHRWVFHLQTGFVGEGSDHLQMIKFWPSRTPGKGVCNGAKKIWLCLTTASTQCLRLCKHFFIWYIFIIAIFWQESWRALPVVNAVVCICWSASRLWRLYPLLNAVMCNHNCPRACIHFAVIFAVVLHYWHAVRLLFPVLLSSVLLLSQFCYADSVCKRWQCV